MDRDELFTSLVAARPGQDDTVYLERRGERYAWKLIPPGESAMPQLDQDGGSPDVWMFLTNAKWPLDDPVRLRAFYADLMDELESMAGGADRCRWPLDEPWPHTH